MRLDWHGRRNLRKSKSMYHFCLSGGGMIRRAVVSPFRQDHPSAAKAALPIRRLGSAEQLVEKRQNGEDMRQPPIAGAEAQIEEAAFSARLKVVPCYKAWQAESFSAACEGVLLQNTFGSGRFTVCGMREVVPFQTRSN